MLLASVASLPAVAAITKVASGIGQDKIYEVYRSDAKLTWSDAKDYSTRVLSAQLVSIRDAQENALVSTLITDPTLWSDSNSPAGNLIGPYLGLYQVPGSNEPDSGWYMVDGASISRYSNWFGNQPDNYNGDNVGVFYNAYEMASANTPWGDVLDGWTISVGPYSPGPNPFLSNSFVVEYPFPLSAITKVSSGVSSGILYEAYKSDFMLTWSNALTYAQTVLGGGLVKIKDEATNIFVSSLIGDPSLWSDSASPACNYIGPYIGLYQVAGSAEPDSGWYWDDGTPLEGYTNWFSNQPDNYNGDNVGVFYNAFEKAVPNSKWGDVLSLRTISEGPYSPGPNPFLSNSFIFEQVLAPTTKSFVLERTPGPLPILGALTAFRWSRRLRRRSSISAPRGSRPVCKGAVDSRLPR